MTAAGDEVARALLADAQVSPAVLEARTEQAQYEAFFAFWQRNNATSARQGRSSVTGVRGRRR